MEGSYCGRLGIGGEIEEIGTVRRCKNCEKLFVSERGQKQKYFCSDKCRMKWWYDHGSQLNMKAVKISTCVFCGKEFKITAGKFSFLQVPQIHPAEISSRQNMLPKYFVKFFLEFLDFWAKVPSKVLYTLYYWLQWKTL